MANRVIITGNFLRIYDDATHKDLIRGKRDLLNFLRSGDNFLFINASPFGTFEGGQLDNTIGRNEDLFIGETISKQTVFGVSELADKDGNPWPSADALDDFLSTNLGASQVQPVAYTYDKITNLGFVGKGIGPARPTTVTVDNSYIETFKIGDELYFDAAPGYDYDSGELEIIVDFCPMGVEVGKEIQFEIDYLTHDEGDLVSGTTGVLQSGDIPLSATQYQSQAYTFQIPSANVKEEIHFRLRRIAINDGEEPAERPGIFHVHLKYKAKLVQ